MLENPGAAGRWLLRPGLELLSYERELNWSGCKEAACREGSAILGPGRGLRPCLDEPPGG